MKHLNRNPGCIQRARVLRKAAGEAEKRLWKSLRRKQLGFRFRRQFAVGPYVLDFYCPTAKVCVEVDGDLHAGREERDTHRDEYLARLGICTLRFWTNELYDNLPGVLERIYQVCRERVKKKED